MLGAPDPVTGDSLAPSPLRLRLHTACQNLTLVFLRPLSPCAFPLAFLILVAYLEQIESACPDPQPLLHSLPQL